MTHLMAALAAYTIEPLNLSAFKLLEKQKPVIAYQSWNSELGLIKEEATFFVGVFVEITSFKNNR